MIQFTAIDIDMPHFDTERMKTWINEVASHYGKRVGEIFYFFYSDEGLLEINKLRLDHDFYTDIITFPLNDCLSIISGELCISLDRIADNAITLGTGFEREFCRVMIHGILHLIGYKDKSEEEEKQMRSEEDICLKIWDNIL